MKSVGKGLGLGVAGWLIGLNVAAMLRGTEHVNDQANIGIAYVFALIGWLLGVGVWDAWIRGWLGLSPKSVGKAEGWRRYFSFCTDHKVIGIQYLVTFISIFLIAGLLAMFMRWELMSAGETIMNAATFNEVMSLHGILMVAVAVAGILGGFGNYLVPLQIGADDMAFPRLNALSFWLVPPVAVLLLLAPLAGGFDSGWTAYPPLSETNDVGQVFFILAIITFGLSSILGGLNLLTTVTTMRASGMKWSRIPIFTWSVFAASILSVLITQFFAASLFMVFLGRAIGMGFFDAAKGGDPVLYQHLFWFYSHPAVYIMILPGFGIMLEVLSHFARKPLFAYKLTVGAFMAIVVLSVVVWAHHMFTSGMSNTLHGPFMILTEIISIPTGVIFLSALGTLWRGKLWLKTPMLFALAMIFNFLIGGITGIFLADVATDINLQDTYFVVAHFHYTIMGGEIFAFFAGIYFWYPKVVGRMYNETMGKIHAIWMFLGFNAVFIPLFYVGIQGMNRRIADYPLAFEGGNKVASISAFILGTSFLLFVWNVVWSAFKGKKAVANPWKATTLEWCTESPPPEHNFEGTPAVFDSPYVYGLESAVHARISKTEEQREDELVGSGGPR